MSSAAPPVPGREDSVQRTQRRAARAVALAIQRAESQRTAGVVLLRVVIDQAGVPYALDCDLLFPGGGAERIDPDAPVGGRQP